MHAHTCTPTHTHTHADTQEEWKRVCNALLTSKPLSASCHQRWGAESRAGWLYNPGCIYSPPQWLLHFPPRFFFFFFSPFHLFIYFHPSPIQTYLILSVVKKCDLIFHIVLHNQAPLFRPEPFRPSSSPRFPSRPFSGSPPCFKFCLLPPFFTSSDSFFGLRMRFKQQSFKTLNTGAAFFFKFSFIRAGTLASFLMPYLDLSQITWTTVNNTSTSFSPVQK